MLKIIRNANYEKEKYEMTYQELYKARTSSFRIAASAFAFCRFSHAVILASSRLTLQESELEKNTKSAS